MTNINLFLQTNNLRDLILMLNAQLENLFEEGMQSEDPDGYGYFDSAESLTGLGFVTCQTYMAACYGIMRIDKNKVLEVGPTHKSGIHVAKIINAAANYWKHNNEWSHKKNRRYEKLTSETFEKVGVPIDGEYPLGGILTELSLPHTVSFEAVMHKLENWKNEIKHINTSN